MKVSLAFPFFSTEDTRLHAFSVIRQEMLGYYDWHRAIIEEGGAFQYGIPFNRGRARNAAVKRLQGSDVIVLCDADSFPEKDPLMRAILGAANDGKVHFPHNTVKTPTEVYGPSAGGCWVVTPRTWSFLGGMEERGGWSVDDRCFLEVMEGLDRGPVFHDGILTCLPHARGAESVLTPESTEIINEYLSLRRDPEKTRAYLNNRT